ncbi:MAG: hypothetical protein NXH75_09850 [Halobacteriovoraceae bacterium]|nr:hypothetical protein [Halobacteriovorax sp.]MBK25427.1 hypothetical protein [Halobacteriovorax sp.]MCR9204871.1 hypothetical protein [Halobacteriovoraceae bacterium]|tara:strand:+ start:2796 stop:3302 length:507 start_codon:yes stop_codon:yes gene_type:complete
MTLERKIAKIFNLTEENWMKHANPWSVWTRYSVLPVIIISFWSRTWIGYWHLIPALISIAWMFFNPIFFKKPKSTRNWASKSVLGERVFLNRDKIEIPLVHKSSIYKILNTISSIGMLISIWSIVSYSIWGAILGTVLTYLGKSWYLDRMVWLYEDMKEVPEYSKWLY